MDATNGIYDFNRYGDARREVDEGVLAYKGDETTTFTNFYPNVDAYAVGCKASQSVYPGVWTTTSAAAAAGVDWIANKRWYMDQTAEYSSPPTTCEVQRELTFTSVAGSYVHTLRTYDDYGNLVEEKNGSGDTTSITYDTTYSLFSVSQSQPVATAAMPSSVVLTRRTTLWDKVCSQPLTEVGFNGETTTNTYDDFCRLVTQTRPGDGVTRDSTTISYEDNIFPNYVYVKNLSPGGLAYKKSVFDGFGRTYVEFTNPASGESLSTAIVRYFNKRGTLHRETVPYTSGGTQISTYFLYDDLDRLVEVINPDSAQVQKTSPMTPILVPMLM